MRSLPDRVPSLDLGLRHGPCALEISLFQWSKRVSFRTHFTTGGGGLRRQPPPIMKVSVQRTMPKDARDTLLHEWQKQREGLRERRSARRVASRAFISARFMFSPASLE